jgi:hypothetical protein
MVGGLCVPCLGPSQISSFLPSSRLCAKYCKASSPAAYPHLSSAALDDLSYDLTIILNQCLSHPSLHPKNLGIIPRRKSWLLNLDAIVLSDSGNVYDALFLAARSALWDTKVPKTRNVQYQPKSNVLSDQDVEMTADGSGSIFNTRKAADAADFELADYWDDGEPLKIAQEWPVCVTLNLVRTVIPIGQAGCVHHPTGISKITPGILLRRDIARGSSNSSTVALTLLNFSIGNATTVDKIDGRWGDSAGIHDTVARGKFI